uniref:Uncharacterized protein n=1 Tax=Arundo donax TaxID=35708 RepID=A0A0A9HX98_ARUDO
MRQGEALQRTERGGAMVAAKGAAGQG